MQQAINRALDILEYVGTDPEIPRGFKEIADNTALNTGTCANIIKAMVNRGYLQKLDDKKGYLLGEKLFKLARFESYKKNISKVAKPHMDELTKTVNENSLIAVLKGNARIVIHQSIQLEQAIQATSAIDKAAYDSSTGRMLVAMLSDKDLESFIMLHGLPTAAQWKEASTSSGFAKQVQKIRKQGYVVQESSHHILGIAVGVIQDGITVASLCLFMPSFRFKSSNLDYLVQELHRASAAISAGLQ